MGVATEIAWTDSTFNAWWGCTKVDPACDHCYAATFDKRIGGANWGPDAPRRFFGDKHWNDPLKWNRDAINDGARRRVFCASMSDWAEDRRDLDPWRVKLFATIRATPALDWLLLTKRANKIAAFLPPDWGDGYPNVWLGVTVGDRKGMWRARELVKIKAAYRFLSIEPLLEAVDISPLMPPGYVASEGGQFSYDPLVDWVIVGGESGAHCRPMDLAWARSLRDQCWGTGVAFFFKQIGGNPHKLDKMTDFPADLRIREFPRGRELGEIGMTLEQAKAQVGRGQALLPILPGGGAP